MGRYGPGLVDQLDNLTVTLMMFDWVGWPMETIMKEDMRKDWKTTGKSAVLLYADCILR